MSVTFQIHDRDPILKVAQFVADVSEVREATDKHKLWFRGHSKAEYKLVPSVGRRHDYGGRRVSAFDAKAEKELLHRFRRRAFAHDDRVSSAGYALFLARHHGLPTRILDWTANVLYALYFACSEHETTDGAIWAFRQRNYTDILDAFDIAQWDEQTLLTTDPLRVKIVHPVFNSQRLVAQEGGFTLHSNPQTPLEDQVGIAFEDGNLDIEHLYRWPVPAVSKSVMVRELSGLGVSRRSAFPDLDGIARSLWETEILWNGN